MSNNNKLFVGNLAFSVSEDDIRTLFAEYGAVTSTSLPLDRETNRPRGFAFVEMETQVAAEAAMKGLDGHQFAGRDMKVSIAQPKARSNRY